MTSLIGSDAISLAPIRERFLFCAGFVWHFFYLPVFDLYKSSDPMLIWVARYDLRLSIISD